MARYNPRAIVFVIAIFIFIFSPTSNPSTSIASSEERQHAKEAFARNWESLAQFNRTAFGDFDPAAVPEGSNDVGKWVNFTGFRAEDNFAWNLLPGVRDKARGFLEHAGGQAGIDLLNGKSEDALPLYRNVTGWLRGSWVRSNVETQYGREREPLNLTLIAPNTQFSSGSWERNITGQEGSLQLRLDETDAITTGPGEGHARSLTAALQIEDETSPGSGWDASMHGVHLLKSGSIILTTMSEKYSGLFGLAHLASTQTAFDQMQVNLNQSVSALIKKREKQLSEARTVESDVSTPRCEMVVFLQQHLLGADQDPERVPGDSLLRLAGTEQELRHPTGGPISAPPMTFSMMLMSPDCGFALESKGPPDWPSQENHHLQGFKSELYLHMVRSVFLGMIVLLAAQIWLLMRQMKDSNTPSRQSKISARTLAMLSMGDSFQWLIFMFLVSIVDALSMTLMAACFFAFLSGSLIPTLFLKDIWSAQEPERMERAREQQRLARETQPAPAPSSSPSPSSSPPPSAPSEEPVTSPLVQASVSTSFFARMALTDSSASPLAAPTPPVPTQTSTTTATTPTTTPDVSVRTSITSFYAAQYLVIVCLLFLTIVAVSSFPPRLLRIYTRFLSFLYLSPWLPQLRRNTLRNTTHALSLRFVLGQSVLRLLPFIWLWGDPPPALSFGLAPAKTLLPVDPDRRWVAVLAAWLWIQLVIFAGQEVLGARWFVWRGWPWDDTLRLPAAWEWHPVLREDEEGGLPVGGADGDGEDAEHKGEPGKRSFECAICMQSVAVAILSRADARPGVLDTLGAGALARKTYMVTPCRHIFHSACLEGWMGYRLQCPICREGLPPL